MNAFSRTVKRCSRIGVPIAVTTALLAGGLLVPQAGSAATVVTGPTDIGTLGGTYSQPTAMNNAGQVIGYSTRSDGSAGAFSWTQAGGMVDLGSLGGTTSIAGAVNDAGVVVGSSSIAGDAEYHLFSWTLAGGMVDLGSLGGSYIQAKAVNHAGQIVGDGYIAGDAAWHPFSWTAAGGMVDLGTFGGTYGYTSGVNASGLVVGYSYLDGNGYNNAFVWTAGALVDLGTLGGPSSGALLVNDAGMVVGMSTSESYDDHGFLWTQAGGMVDIGPIVQGGPSAMNASGQVVGRGSARAFSWTQAGGKVDVGTLGGHRSAAVGVNASGLVVGTGTIAGDSISHAFAWTPAGGITDLGTLGGPDSYAFAVNDAGLVAGMSRATTTSTYAEYHAVVWQVASTAPGSGDQVVSAGDIVNTDPGGLGPTVAVPVQTRVVVPTGVAGQLTVTPQPAGAPPAGYQFFSEQVVITGPVAPTASAPYVATFAVDASALVDSVTGAVTAPGDVQVFRNGVAVLDCTDPVQAMPNPCVAARGFVSGTSGDVFVTVRTTQFSTWSVGRLVYQPTGFFAPVDNMPTVNTVKAGSAVPVKFGLGGNRGLNVFAAGSPSSVSMACGSGVSDPVEQTVTAGASSLGYDSGSACYQYVWKTEKTWTGCRDLTLRFRDGSTLRARFSFK